MLRKLWLLGIGVASLPLPLELVPETALQAAVPFFFGLSIDDSGQNVGGILPGLTFAVPAAPEDIYALERVAPSEYQHKRWRDGGLRVGGRNVQILDDELIAGLLRGRPFDISPIPVDYISGLSKHQSGRRLPAFLGSLSSERLLEEWEYPVWQIWRDDLQDKKTLKSLTDYISPMLRQLVPNESSSDLIAFAVETFPQEPLPQIRFYFRNEPHDTPKSYISSHEVEVTLTGLTGVIRSKRLISLDHEARREGCRLMIDHFMPRETYVDGDELKRHRRRHNTTIILPQFHEIELPEHLAAPAIFQEVIDLGHDVDKTALDEMQIDDFGLPFHNRYRLNPSDGSSARTPFAITLPVMSIDCGKNNVRLVGTKKISVSGEARLMGGRLLIESPEISRKYLPQIAVLTSVYVLGSVVAIHKAL